MPALTRINNKEGLEISLNGIVVHRRTWDEWRALNEKYSRNLYPSIIHDGDRVLVDAIQHGLPQHLGPAQMQPFSTWAEEMLRGIPQNERTYKIETSTVPIPENKDRSMVSYTFVLKNSP